MSDKKEEITYSSVAIKLFWVVILIHAAWATIASVICMGHYETDYPLSSDDIKSYNDDSSRREMFFNGTDARIHSWVYTPNPLTRLFKKSPLVVVAHGLGAQKDMGLDFYCRKFVLNGFACLILDYRTFGGSDTLKSQPHTRNLIYPWYHVADIKTVVAAVGKGVLGPSIDETKIALWGTSFGGGHVLQVAADLKRNHAIKAVVSQVPHLDGRAASKRGARQRGILGTVRLAILAISDITRSFFGWDPIYIRIAGNLKAAAYMNLADEHLKTYFSKHPKKYLGGWKNLTPARTLAMMSLYNPINAVPKINIPILFLAASNDTLCPAAIVEKAASKAIHGSSKLVTMDASHFDIYSGNTAKQAVNHMLVFLNAHLK